MNSLSAALLRFWRSSIGKKIIVAVTGVFLIGFLIGHVSGNLLVFAGRDAMNGYAEFLQGMLHGVGIWIVRAGLLALFVIHIVATVSLVRQNRAARENRYEFPGTVQATRSSRIMIWSGLTVLGFVIFHILHFTVRIDPGLANLHDPAHPERHDVFAMVVKGFQNPLVILVYIIGVSLLCSHLSHGIASIFQTLGLRSEKSQGTIRCLGWFVAIVIWAGFLLIPVSVKIGLVNDDPADSSKDAAVLPIVDSPAS